MITKAIAFIDSNYREIDYDEVELDHIKDLFRKDGLVDARECTMLCGKRQYTNMENKMLPYILDYKSDLNKSGTKYFRKQGILWKIIEVHGLEDWSLVVLTTQVDI